MEARLVLASPLEGFTMSEKRRGLGRGLGALIPSSAAANGSANGGAVSRPVDLFFPEGRKKTEPVEQTGPQAPAKVQEK
jgi:ParB family chromosome partitioning protein